MRTLALVLLVAFLAAACDGGPAELTTRDVGGPSADGCVVTEPVAPGAPTRWTVRQGDSLRRIAKRVYGTETLWKAIRDANAGRVGADDSIAVGAELVIPREGI